MSESKKLPVGSIGWVDLTVPEADKLRDFYASVVGWKPADVPMCDYSDYTMKEPESGKAVSGVCHARGQNSGLPAQWLIYITVANLDESVSRCRSLGGSVVKEPTRVGTMGRFAVIRDPAGAVAALWEPA